MNSLDNKVCGKGHTYTTPLEGLGGCPQCFYNWESAGNTLDQCGASHTPNTACVLDSSKMV